MEALRQGEVDLEIPDINESKHNSPDTNSPSPRLNVHPKVTYWTHIQDTEGIFAALHPLRSDHDLVAAHRDVTDTDREMINPGPTSNVLSLEAGIHRKRWI